MAEEPWEARTTEAWLAHQDDERFGAMADAQDRKNCLASLINVIGVIIIVITAIGGVIYFAGWR